ncbi:hypothetical protein TNIN_402011 [Trichonephila inaurata madagascariensis]|uniref:Uncharacterized protein n=1 Tax=Trichonephila inaurata madagascariensis TaxID=2747483 RepID=A0A8X7CBZ1_9ARAC|nr:hypothetical protein TNIN_402011 [Trichonephila inaurata madagascariensis]
MSGCCLKCAENHPKGDYPFKQRLKIIDCPKCEVNGRMANWCGCRKFTKREPLKKVKLPLNLPAKTNPNRIFSARLVTSRLKAMQ